MGESGDSGGESSSEPEQSSMLEAASDMLSSGRSSSDPPNETLAPEEAMEAESEACGICADVSSLILSPRFLEGREWESAKGRAAL